MCRSCVCVCVCVCVSPAGWARRTNEQDEEDRDAEERVPIMNCRIGTTGEIRTRVTKRKEGNIFLSGPQRGASAPPAVSQLFFSPSFQRPLPLPFFSLIFIDIFSEMRHNQVSDRPNRPPKTTSYRHYAARKEDGETSPHFFPRFFLITISSRERWRWGALHYVGRGWCVCVQCRDSWKREN